jgi:hypothetical protein
MHSRPRQESAPTDLRPPLPTALPAYGSRPHPQPQAPQELVQALASDVRRPVTISVIGRRGRGNRARERLGCPCAEIRVEVVALLPPKRRHTVPTARSRAR